MKRTTVLWIGGSIACFFLIILLLMYLTLQPSEEFVSVEQVFTEYMFPGRVNKYLSIQLGPISLFLLKKAIQTTSIVGNLEYDPSLFLQNITKGEFGIYEVQNPDSESRSAITRKLTEKMGGEGWKRFMSVRDRDSNVEGFLKSGDTLDGLFLYILDGNDLIIISVGADA